VIDIRRIKSNKSNLSIGKEILMSECISKSALLVWLNEMKDKEESISINLTNERQIAKHAHYFYALSTVINEIETSRFDSY